MRRLRGEKLKIETFELSDPVGLAASDKELNAVILTHEVIKGGLMINEKRKENQI